MAKAKKVVKKSPRKMVWQIAKFSDRFEFRDDKFKKKQLNFTKNFVASGPDDISAECTRQLDDLRLYNDEFAFNLLRGTFWSLVSRSADAGILLRGYILDGARNPATNKRIGVWEMLAPADVGRMMKILEKVKLIERVELPDFDKMEEPTPPKPPKPPERPKTKAQIAAEKKKAKAEAAKAKKDADEAAKAENTESAENQEKNETFQEAAKRQNGKTANGNPEGKAASGKTANPEDVKETALTGQGQGQSQGPQEPMPGHLPAAEAAKGAKGNGTQLRAKTGEDGAVADAVGQADANIDSKAPDELSNAHRPPGPHKPTQADGSGSKATADTDGSLTSTQDDGGDSLTSGAFASGSDPPLHYDNSGEPTFEQKYDPRCQAFAIAIYRAIRGRHPIRSPEAYREMATFATQWSYAQESAIGDTQLGVLWGKAVDEATKLGRKRRMKTSPRSPEAVWITVFKGRLGKLVAERGTEVRVPKSAHA